MIINNTKFDNINNSADRFPNNKKSIHISFIHIKFAK